MGRIGLERDPAEHARDRSRQGSRDHHAFRTQDDTADQLALPLRRLAPDERQEHEVCEQRPAEPGGAAGDVHELDKYQQRIHASASRPAGFIEPR